MIDLEKNGKIATGVKSKNIYKPILIGHSLGGMIVQELITKHIDFAKAAILVATSAKFGSNDLSWQNN